MVMTPYPTFGDFIRLLMEGKTEAEAVALLARQLSDAIDDRILAEVYADVDRNRTGLPADAEVLEDR